MSRTDDLRAALLRFAQKVERRTIASISYKQGKGAEFPDLLLEQTNIELAVEEICQIITEDAA